MRVCDYIADKVYSLGVNEVFLVTGGGSMFLTDGIASHPQLKGVPCHHEQAVAMAVVGYAKYSGFGAGFVTTGCGGTNALTGVLNAYQDSTACIFFSGNCATNEIIANAPVHLRQLGMQEADIINIVKPVTKYAVTIMESGDAVYEIEKGIYIARSGRPGPVWIDVPMDIQQAEVDPNRVKHFEVPDNNDLCCPQKDMDEIVKAFGVAKRPVILAGHGIRLADATSDLARFIEQNSIPIVFSRNGHDVYPTGKDLNIGCIGIRGSRAGNFAVNNADFVLSIGSRLSICATGYVSELFAREAQLYVVDVDEEEHKKETVKIDKFIHADAKDLLSRLPDVKRQDFVEWATICKRWKDKFPMCTSESYDDEKGVSMYAFTNELSKCLKEDDVVITDAGSTCYVGPQALVFNTGRQRYIQSSAQAEMGFTVPASVGVCFAKGRSNTIGIVGDGSFQMNIQELQTIKHNNLPIKLFVWNNDGYLSIRGTQKNRFNGRYLGVSAATGTSLPELKKISDAYGIKYCRIDKIDDIDMLLKEILEENCPVICEVMCQYDEWIVCSWSKKILDDGTVIPMPLEDMVPFIDRDIFYKEMIVKPVS